MSPKQTRGPSPLVSSWSDYQLVDSGEGRKLERFGPYLLDRPEPNALWKRKEANLFGGADARFSDDKWHYRRQLPSSWEMRYQPLGLKFTAACRPFKHTGVFPEQASHWHWLSERARDANVLVLFGYTGLATLALARAGAHVTHVDASKPTIAWAKSNAALSGVESRPVRWLIDDALKFVRREARRGDRYDGVVLDPPVFGRGPSGEIWRLESSLPKLLDAIGEVLSPTPRFILLNAYAVPISPTTLGNLLSDLVPGTPETGELALDGGSRVLPCGPYARWSAP